MKKNLAFTLVETLIVIGIIGVVSALTLPNLNNSTNNKERIAKLKKVYVDLNTAFANAEATYGPIKNWFKKDTWVDVNDVGGLSSRIGGRLTDFLKVSKICGTETGDCICSKYGYKNGSNEDGIDIPHFGTGVSNYYRFILADGTSVALITFTHLCTPFDRLAKVGYKLCGWIGVDISGPTKGKHILGYDYFQFFLTDHGIFPVGTKMDTDNDTNEELKTNCFSKGGSCAGWVFENDNMDYLRADSNGVCPNGTILSWENTSCN